MGVAEVFKKQGGMGLIKEYAKTRSLFTAICEFLLLGKERTALEILRLSAGFKTKNYFRAKYKNVLSQINSKNAVHYPNDSRYVWVCWLQGIENAPEIVKVCYDSICKNVKNKKIVLITEKNYKDYVSFPDYIQNKIDSKVINYAHVSDLIRLELLLKYGGTWIDSTVLMANDNLPDYLFDSELFLFQNLKPGRDGHSTVISNWFISASKDNYILRQVQKLLYLYWKDCDEDLVYAIFHIFFQLVIEKCPEDWNKVIPFSNSEPHIILLRIFEEYDETIWKEVTTRCPVQKLTYKRDEKDKLKPNTFYSKIVHGNAMVTK